MVAPYEFDDMQLSRSLVRVSGSAYNTGVILDLSRTSTFAATVPVDPLPPKLAGPRTQQQLLLNINKLKHENHIIQQNLSVLYEMFKEQEKQISMLRRGIREWSIQKSSCSETTISSYLLNTPTISSSSSN